jgi:hypothetical protein
MKWLIAALAVIALAGCDPLVGDLFAIGGYAPLWTVTITNVEVSYLDVSAPQLAASNPAPGYGRLPAGVTRDYLVIHGSTLTVVSSSGDTVLCTTITQSSQFQL